MDLQSRITAADRAIRQIHHRLTTSGFRFTQPTDSLPGPEPGTDQAITRIEAAGWKLENQHEDVRVDHGFRQTYWTLTFRAKADVPSEQ